MITDDPKSTTLKLEDDILKREPSTPEEQLLETAFMGNYDKCSTLIIQKRVDVNCVGPGLGLSLAKKFARENFVALRGSASMANFAVGKFS